jgi:hypothetical protein
MGGANTSGPQPGPSAGADKTPPAAVPVQPAQPPEQKADAPASAAAAADAAHRKQRDITISAVVSVGSVFYLLWKLANHAPVNGWDWLFTFGALGVGARLILLNLAVAGAVVLGWLIGIFAWGAIAVTAASAVWDGVLAPMTTPLSEFLIQLPTASPGGACTTDPVGWVLGAFHPGACAGVALSRLGVAALGVVVLIVMRNIWVTYGMWKIDKQRREMTRLGNEETTVTGKIAGPEKPVVAQATPDSEKARVKRRTRRRRLHRHTNPAQR